MKPYSWLTLNRLRVHEVHMNNLQGIEMRSNQGIGLKDVIFEIITDIRLLHTTMEKQLYISVLTENVIPVFFVGHLVEVPPRPVAVPIDRSPSF